VVPWLGLFSVGGPHTHIHIHTHTERDRTGGRRNQRERERDSGQKLGTTRRNQSSHPGEGSVPSMQYYSTTSYTALHPGSLAPWLVSPRRGHASQDQARYFPLPVCAASQSLASLAQPWGASRILLGRYIEGAGLRPVIATQPPVRGFQR